MIKINLKKTLFLLPLAFMAFTMTGCKSKPVKNVESQAVPSTVQSANEVKDSIIRAGASLGWIIKEKDTSTLQGTLLLRDHVAKIKIPYSKSSYSLIYQGSEKLDYNAEEKTIHSNYNGWIQNLDRNIQLQLSAM